MSQISDDNLIRREDRAKQTAEVFTPPVLVRRMLDKLPKEVWKKGKTFLDPACGNGNLVVPVLVRKIDRGHKPLEALKTIYGIDVMKDNVLECRLRLLKIIQHYGGETITEEHIQTVFTNIAWISLKKSKGMGALDPDFAFKSNRQSKQNIERWLKMIEDGKLEEVSLPIDETEIIPEDWIDFGEQNN